MRALLSALVPRASMPLFTESDAERAYKEWGANCGPGAIAAIACMTLDELRPHMGDFEQKGYTNPTLMWDVLNRLGVRWTSVTPPRWPQYGLVRVQWEGPWTAPGAPMRARYRYTHWVGANALSPTNIGVFDINTINNGTGWCALQDWERSVVPWILGQYPRASGAWHITHSVEVRLP